MPIPIFPPLRHAIIALTAIAVSQAHAGYPYASEMAEVQQNAVQLEVDTNEAYFVSRDNADPSNVLEDEALADLNELRIAAFEFSENVRVYYARPQATENSFALLNGAYLQAVDSFRYLRAYTMYRPLFGAIISNIESLQMAYDDIPDYRSPVRVIVYYPDNYSYYYPYWRYPDHYHRRHLSSGYYRDPWNRYPNYRDPRHRYPHRHREGWDRHRDRHRGWEERRRAERGRDGRRVDPPRRGGDGRDGRRVDPPRRGGDGRDGRRVDPPRRGGDGRDGRRVDPPRRGGDGRDGRRVDPPRRGGGDRGDRRGSDRRGGGGGDRRGDRGGDRRGGRR